MLPDGSLSGSPSHSGHDLSDTVEYDEWLSHFRNIVVVSSSRSPRPKTCQIVWVKRSTAMAGANAPPVTNVDNCSNTRDVCNTIATFIEAPINVHHVERLFLRRWDMERYLHKSKYGCPANRFSSSGYFLMRSESPWQLWKWTMSPWPWSAYHTKPTWWLLYRTRWTGQHFNCSSMTSAAEIDTHCKSLTRQMNIIGKNKQDYDELNLL